MEIVTWWEGRKPIRGTITEYIRWAYPVYATLNLKDWDEVYNYLLEKKNEHTSDTL